MEESETTAVDHGEVGPSGTMEAIVAAHEQALLRYAMGLLNNVHAAQDAVQNAFIKLFKTWKPGLKPTPALRAWLYRVTHNEAVDHIRHESRLKILHWNQAKDPAVSLPVSDNPGEEKTEQMERVLTQLARLALPERQVVLLRLQEGLSYEEIARVTGRTEGNVGCLLHQAVRRLSRLLKRGEDKETVRR
ncbi:MAG: sigma-70 family RNA polymerase sigma factor [Lentisphaerae bacterium]|nr:sigma-70 family RNA polymerase sigma factor [Lentisphaerota bacterium]